MVGQRAADVEVIEIPVARCLQGEKSQKAGGRVNSAHRKNFDSKLDHGRAWLICFEEGGRSQTQNKASRHGAE